MRMCVCVASMYVCIYICMCACVCMYVCMYVCVYIYIYTYIYIYIYIYIYMLRVNPKTPVLLFWHKKNCYFVRVFIYFLPVHQKPRKNSWFPSSHSYLVNKQNRNQRLSSALWGARSQGARELLNPWLLQGPESQGTSDQGNPDPLVRDSGPQIWISGSCLVCFFN